MLAIKIGGGKQINIEGIAKDIAEIDEEVVILHGANSYRDELAEALQYEKKIITSMSGFSSVYSDEELLDLMLMSYAGLRNKRIVQQLQSQGINAIGLSGVDGRVLEGEKHRGIRAVENGKKKIIRDLSGKVKSINTELLNLLLANGYVPVLTVPIIGKNNHILNSENDDIFALLVSSLDVTQALMLIEEEGFLRDYYDKSSVLDSVTPDGLQDLIDNSDGRIKRKLYAIKKIVGSSTSLVLSDGRIDHPVIDALYGSGTKFTIHN